MSEVKSQIQLDRIARTAENFEIRQRKVSSVVHFSIAGPKDDKGRVYWPDVCLMHNELWQAREGDAPQLFKITGNVIRFNMENGHGLYHILGHYQDTYLVLSKLSSSIEHAA